IPPHQVRDTTPHVRDPERTPMQWTAGPHAGFSSAKPWLPLERTYKQRNVDVMSKDKHSLLALYRLLIDLHQKHSALQQGDYLPVVTGHPQVFGFKRTLDNQSVTVLINFSAKAALAKTKFGKGKVLASSRMDKHHTTVNLAQLILRPYEAVIVK
ncbi:MAG TPA: hypothetical protein VMR98_00375, partial [Candidatus Polarisedimenticolaceae bacterium]|nr:hypothetical protein [Candidatus Polarisedimenticolaceae bacterium]